MMEVSNQRLLDEVQRQSPAGIVIEGLVGFYKYLKAFWYFVIFIIIRLMRYDMIWIFVALGVLVVLILVIGYLRYRHFSFFIDQEREEFVLREGVFSKERIAIQLSRIQQVNVNQSVVQKLLNVYGVEINTAGSTKSEAKISAVRWEVAQALREHLLTSKEPSLPGENENSLHDLPAAPFFTIQTSSLIKQGLTSKYVESFSLLIAFIFAIYNNVKDFVRLQEENEEQVDDFISGYLVLNSALFFVFALFVTAIFINLLRTVFTFYHLQVRKDAHKLEVTYGLLQSRTILLNPNKVQIISVVSNYFQNKMKLGWMTVKQASSDSALDVKSHIHFPACSPDEQVVLLQELFGKLPTAHSTLVPSIRLFWIALLKWMVLPLMIGIGVYLFVPVFDFSWIWLVSYGVLSTLICWRMYANSRLSYGDDFIICRQGIWDVGTYMFETYKIQSIKTSQYIWQKKHNIGQVIVYTSGGNIRFRYGDFDKIEHLVNHWLMVVETSRKPWM